MNCAKHLFITDELYKDLADCQEEIEEVNREIISKAEASKGSTNAGGQKRFKEAIRRGLISEDQDSMEVLLKKICFDIKDY